MFDKIYELVLSGELEILDKQDDLGSFVEDGDYVSINGRFLFDCFIKIQLVKLGCEI